MKAVATPVQPGRAVPSALKLIVPAGVVGVVAAGARVPVNTSAVFTVAVLPAADELRLSGAVSALTV